MNRATQRKLTIALLLIIILLQSFLAYLSIKNNGITPDFANKNVESNYEIEKIAEDAVPAVVHILTGDKSGSGVIVSKDGYILTNNHVVDGSGNISVRLTDKRIFNAKLIGSDPKTDIALLDINASDLPTIEFGDSDAVNVGENVLAIGNPYGFDFTVTMGIISAKHRERGPTEYRDFLQTDAPINPGNSGGPLVDMNGKIIGITTFIVSDVRAGELGFAIPINLAKTIMDRLIKFGKVDRSYLGVSLQDKVVVNQKGEGRILDGAEIVSFDSKGPAIKSGLKEKDIIIKVNGEEIESSNHLRNLVAWIPIGENITITVLRDEKELNFNLITTLRPSSF